MLNVKNIFKSYGTSRVLQDVSFSVGRGQKIALVGANGTGKSTLLKIIAGIAQQDRGSVEIHPGIQLGYLEQEMVFLSDETIEAYLRRVSGVGVLEAEMNLLVNDGLDDPERLARFGDLQEQFEHLHGYQFSSRVDAMFAGFGIETLEKTAPLKHASSGQRSKIALIGILLKGVDLLLLDEPTNNLDIPSLVWLEEFLRITDVSCVVVSHDRRFLDNTVTKVMEIDRFTRELHIRNGSYSEYLLAAEKERARQWELYHQYQDEVERLTVQARERKTDAAKGAHWVGTDNDKFLRGFKRDQSSGSARGAKAIESRIERLEKVDKPVERAPLRIPLTVERNFGDLTIAVDGLVAGYPSGFKIGPCALHIGFGERIGIIGLNGSGKSTFLKALLGSIPVLSGSVKIGKGVRIGNFTQEHESLPGDMTQYDCFASLTGLKDHDVYNPLRKFGFLASEIEEPLSLRSPGGRARFLLAVFAAQGVNVLVLDEPTNHLDLEAQQALEEALGEYRGTIILVSHDRAFIEKVGPDSLYEFRSGTLERARELSVYVQDAEVRAKKLARVLERES